MANLRNPGAQPRVRVRWLPDTELEEVDLSEPVAGRPTPPGEGFTFLLELVGSSGQRRMHAVDRFSSDNSTWDWPVWRKRAPIGMRNLVGTDKYAGRENLELVLKRK